jgi:hypothetical protein
MLWTTPNNCTSYDEEILQSEFKPRDEAGCYSPIHSYNKLLYNSLMCIICFYKCPMKPTGSNSASRENLHAKIGA